MNIYLYYSSKCFFIVSNQNSPIPLDLRLSPAMRRNPCQDKNVIVNAEVEPVTDISPIHAEQVNTVPKLLAVNCTDEYHTTSNVSNLDTVYETCQSFNENRTELNELAAIPEIQADILQTPRTTGQLKKSTSFAERNSTTETPPANQTKTDIWFTPSTEPFFDWKRPAVLKVKYF